MLAVCFANYFIIGLLRGLAPTINILRSNSCMSRPPRTWYAISRMELSAADRRVSREAMVIATAKTKTAHSGYRRMFPTLHVSQ